MPEPLEPALAVVRDLLLDDGLVRAVAAGRRRGAEARPPRSELRRVAVAAGPRVVLTESDSGPGGAPLTRTLIGEDLAVAVDDLLSRPYNNWHVETVAETLQLRVTKRGEAQVHRAPRDRPAPAGTASAPAPVSAPKSSPSTSGGSDPRVSDPRASTPVVSGRTAFEPRRSGPGESSQDASDSHASAEDTHGRLPGHDRVRRHLLAPDDPLFAAVGANAAKRRQVDAFLRLLDPVTQEHPADRPLRVVDLGCGHAALTLAAHRWLSRRGPVLTTGVDVRDHVVARDADLVARLGEDGVSFVPADVADYEPPEPPDIVLALHACDTATDAALERAVRWGATAVLAAPCCHHDLRHQLAGRGPEHADPALRGALRHGILRQRLLDTVTDALRADLLRLFGYRVDAVEFVDPEHTPRNTLLRAVRTAAPPPAGLAAEVAATCAALGVRPVLATSLGWSPPPTPDLMTAADPPATPDLAPTPDLMTAADPPATPDLAPTPDLATPADRAAQPR